MSHRGPSRGVPDGDPIAIILTLYMTFILLFWFQSSTAINPLSGNSSITTSYSTAWTGVRWFGLLMAPFVLFLLVRGFVGEGSVFHRGGEEDEE